MSFAIDASVEVTLYDLDAKRTIVIQSSDLQYFPRIEKKKKPIKIDENVFHNFTYESKKVSFNAFISVLVPIAKSGILSNNQPFEAVKAVIGFVNKNYNNQTDLIAEALSTAQFLKMSLIVKRGLLNCLYDLNAVEASPDNPNDILLQLQGELVPYLVDHFISNKHLSSTVVPNSNAFPYHSSICSFKNHNIRLIDIFALVELFKNKPGPYVFDFSNNKIKFINFAQLKKVCNGCDDIMKLSVFDLRGNPLSDQIKDYIKTNGQKSTEGLNLNSELKSAINNLTNENNRKNISIAAVVLWGFSLLLLWKNLASGWERSLILSIGNFFWIMLIRAMQRCFHSVTDLTSRIALKTKSAENLIKVDDLFFVVDTLESVAQSKG